MSNYKEYAKKYNAVWSYMLEISGDYDEVIANLCKLRGYTDQEKWYNLFKKVGICHITKESKGVEKLLALADNKEFDDLALFTTNKKGEKHFLLFERYIIPLKDMLGNVVALIGWYPDARKYITTPSKYFKKNCLFFGLEQLSQTGLNADYVLVEGIFDSLNLRALGIHAVAQMGIVASREKEVSYGLFGNLLAIPDNDNEGRKVIKEDKWRLPINCSYFRWKGSLSEKDLGGTEEAEQFTIKDIDNFCEIFDEDSVKEALTEGFKSNERVVVVSI